MFQRTNSTYFWLRSQMQSLPRGRLVYVCVWWCEYACECVCEYSYIPLCVWTLGPKALHLWLISIHMTFPNRSLLWSDAIINSCRSGIQGFRAITRICGKKKKIWRLQWLIIQMKLSSDEIHGSFRRKSCHTMVVSGKIHSFICSTSSGLLQCARCYTGHLRYTSEQSLEWSLLWVGGRRETHNK